jgi:hypothetical protein
MLFTSLRFRWTEETAQHRVAYDAEFGQTRLLGMMDDNLDGKLQKAELKGNAGAMLLKYFDVLDKNKDGVLDKSELVAAQAMMGARRTAASAPPAPALGATAAAAPAAGGR